MKLTLPDELQGSARAAFDSLREHFPANSVCVNVMLGPDPWDVRPLLLTRGSVFLYRTSPSLSSDRLRHLASEIEGFSLLASWQTSVKLLPATDRFLLVRPFVQHTLGEVLERSNPIPQPLRLAIAKRLIEQILELEKRNLVHGHICPANVALGPSNLENLFLLDPRIGGLAEKQGFSFAPELLTSHHDPLPSADIYGLGLCLKGILQDACSSEQRDCIERLTLSSPRQRPDISMLSDLFLGAAPRVSTSSGRGRIISGSPQVDAPASDHGRPFREQSPQTLAASTTELLPIVGHVRRYLPRLQSFLAMTAGVALLVAVLRYVSPRLYNDVAFYIPLPVTQNQEEFRTSLASGDRSRILAVARSAVTEHNPAAIRAILDDVGNGATRPGLNPRLLQIAYRSPWKEALSRTDLHTLLALTVAPILPDGLSELPPLISLHPAVIVAVAAQISPTDTDPQLKSIPIESLVSLGDPEGVAFEKLKGAGIDSVGNPIAIALCQLIAGNAQPAAYEALFGSTTELAATLERLAIVLPVIMDKPAVAEQLLGTIRDRGGDLGNVLSWFDIDSLVGWSSVPSAAKLLLLLQQVPSVSLGVSHYADLLKFPLYQVREKAAAELKARAIRPQEASLLALLASDQNRLTREQTIALISGLALEPQKRAPFIALWFQMKPNPETALLVLLGRSNVDSQDLLNLEAARYLKKSSWRVTTEMLKLLAQHPEPLARTLAYARLDPSDPSQKEVLKGRISNEKDAALLKLITAKLSAEVGSVTPTTTTSVHPTP